MQNWIIILITAIAVIVLEIVGKKLVYPLIMYIVEKFEKKKELEKRVTYIEEKLGIDPWEYKGLRPMKEVDPLIDDDSDISKKSSCRKKPIGGR